MLEFLIEVLGEFLFQAVGEVLLNLGAHAVAEPFRRHADPWLAALGYLILGGLLGVASLFVVPHLLVGTPWRVANLVLTPIAVGGLMAALGAWRARRGEPLLRIDRFACGYLFALAVALVRFFSAQ
ncbi:hypothetical protein [Rhizobacter sp. LjRoot28]|jgi:hypothetical protein|uniref:hypothetical protein n=1 Tax=Rhizobacter sp. LjRoot28 TaxID=3342309 RepID=UPI003ECF3E8C